MQAHARTTSLANETARHRSTYSQQSVHKVLPQHVKGSTSSSPKGFQFMNIVSVMWTITFTFAILIFFSSLLGFFYTPSVDVVPVVSKRVVNLQVAYVPKKESQLQHLDLSDPIEEKPEQEYHLPHIPQPNEEDVFHGLNDEDVSTPDVIRVDGRDIDGQTDDLQNIKIRDPARDAQPPPAEGKLRIVRGKGAFSESEDEEEEPDGKRRLKRERQF